MMLLGTATIRQTKDIKYLLNQAEILGGTHTSKECPSSLCVWMGISLFIAVGVYMH